MKIVKLKIENSSPSSKILALDFGTKLIGYAISDADAKIAFPRGTLANKSETKLLKELQKIIAEEKICKIILGVPLGEDNEETDVSKRIRGFGSRLTRKLKLPVEYVDEFGSSKEALGKIPFKKYRRKKGETDSIAAQIILQRYLDANTDVS